MTQTCSDFHCGVSQEAESNKACTNQGSKTTVSTKMGLYLFWLLGPKDSAQTGESVTEYSWREEGGEGGGEAVGSGDQCPPYSVYATVPVMLR